MELDDEKMARAYVRMVIKEVSYSGVYGPIPTFNRTASALKATKDLAKAGVKQLSVNLAQVAGSGILLPLINVFSPQKAKEKQDSFRKEIVKAEKRAFEAGKKPWGVVWDQLNVDGDAALFAMAVAPQAALAYLTGKVTFGAMDILTGGIIKEKLGEKFEEIKKNAFEPLPNIDTADVSTKIAVAEQQSKMMRFLNAYAGIQGIISRLNLDDLNTFSYNSILSLRSKVSEYMNLYTRTAFLVESKQFRDEVVKLRNDLQNVKQGTPDYELAKGKYQEALISAYSEIIAKLAVAAEEYDKALKNLPVRDPMIEGYKKQILTAKTQLSKIYTDVFNKVRKIQTTRPQLEKQIVSKLEQDKAAKSSEQQGGPKSTEPAKKTELTTSTTPAQGTQPTK